MDVQSFSGCVLEKLYLPKLEYVDTAYINNLGEKFNLAKIDEFIILIVRISYEIFTKINLR